MKIAGDRRRFDAVDAIVAMLVAAWVLVITATRFAPGFDRWRAETDAKQVTHQFYAWFDKGTFPAGELLEQYADIYNAPPLYKAVMATLSSVFDPKDAAIGLSVFLYLATISVLYAVGWRRGGSGVAAAAALLYVHAEGPLLATVGGHPRSFAPLFFALFLWSLVERRRGVILVLLVLEGGIYPSPLLACGPAAAVIVAFDFWRERRPAVVGWFLVASVLALGLAKAQDLRAPTEWGRIISYEEALKHPAWQRGSRFPYVPLPSFWKHPEEAVERLVAPVGEPLLNGGGTVLWGMWAALGLAGIVAMVRRRRFDVAPELLLLGATLFAHLLARQLAFQLHIPHRAVAHGWPVILASLLPTLAWLGMPRFLAKAASPHGDEGGTAGQVGVRPAERVVGAVAGMLIVVPLVLFAGAGVRTPRLWRDYSKDARLYEWIQKKTPKDAIFAGNFQIMDEVPLFGRRRVYVNWKLAHPYRLGYFERITERTRKMYSALYATNIDDVVAFADDTGVDYIIVDPGRFKALEKGDGQLFEPLRSIVKPMFATCEKTSCALNPPPSSAVVFKTPRYLVVSVAALRKEVAKD